MNEYRRRFVAFTMSLIGTVMLIVFVSLGIFMHRSAIAELENTMRLVIEPWDAQSIGSRPSGMRPASPQSGSRATESGRFEQSLGNSRFNTHGIETVFYNSFSGDVMLLNVALESDIERIYSAVLEIVDLEKGYGTLSDYNFIYCCECINGVIYKIALADTSFILSRTAKNALILSGVFVASMVSFYFISRRLSKLAVKPMEDAMEMERQFVADLSHDLKTPVTVVLANNSILRSNADATVKEQLQWIDSNDNAAKNMMQLLNRMLELSALEASKKPEKQPVGLSQTAEKCILQLESLAYDKNIELSSDIPDDILVWGDTVGVERIISGLIDNAIKYEPVGGKVKIWLEKVRKKALLHVHNQGSFIAQEDLPHIFERFYRSDRARTERGHGLGLPILKKRAELIGADIEVKSSGNDGTSFTVIFDIV